MGNGDVVTPHSPFLELRFGTSVAIPVSPVVCVAAISKMLLANSCRGGFHPGIGHLTDNLDKPALYIG